MNIAKLKKDAKRNWKSSFEGKEMLGQLPNVDIKELPYHTYKDHIDHLENLVVNLLDDKFRYPIVCKQLKEAKLLFIYRYEWEYGENSHPFDRKWIYKKYKELKSETKNI